MFHHIKRKKETIIDLFLNWRHITCAVVTYRPTCADLSAPQGGVGGTQVDFSFAFFRFLSFPPFLCALYLSVSLTFCKRVIRDRYAEMSANERSIRALKEILQKPGNDVCADCGARGKLKTCISV